jgi:hypothetical protein
MGMQLGLLQNLAATVARVKQLQYEAYVDLRGVQLDLRRLVTTGSARRDVFGDLLVDSPQAQWTTAPATFVIDFSEVVRILDQAQSTASESNLSMDAGPDIKFPALVKLGTLINVGDQIDIPYNLIGIQSSAVQQVTCQVYEVLVGQHLYPYSKKVMLFVKP